MVGRFIVAGCMAALASAAFAQANAPKPMARADFVKSLDTRFAAIDANHDGFLSKAEMQAEEQRALQKLTELRNQKMQATFKQLDTNHDGSLSFQEFNAIAPGIRADQTIDQALAQLDTNHDGKIGPDEFKAPQMAKFNKADLNHDGTVTPDEAKRAAGQK
jgi:Ca2+-binding EF-hand superfamily protein